MLFLGSAEESRDGNTDDPAPQGRKIRNQPGGSIVHEQTQAGCLAHEFPQMVTLCFQLLPGQCPMVALHGDLPTTFPRMPGQGLKYAAQGLYSRTRRPWTSPNRRAFSQARRRDDWASTRFLNAW